MIFFLLTSLASAAVQELTADTFDSIVTGQDRFLLKFYAPWCGHCKKLAPIFDTLATTLPASIGIAKIDCTVASDLCGRFKVRGYPSLKVVDQGQMYAYRGRERSVDALSAFVNGGFKVDSTAHPFPAAGEASASKTVKEADPVVDNGARAAAAAMKRDDAVKAGVKEQVSLLWDAPGAPGKLGRWDGSPLTSDLVRTLSDGNFDSRTSDGHRWFLQFCIPGNRQCEIWRATTDRVATTIKPDDVMSAAIDCTLTRSLCDRMQIAEFPSLRILDGGKLYTWTGERSHDALAQFAISGFRSAPSYAVPAVGTAAPANAKEAYMEAVPPSMQDPTPPPPPPAAADVAAGAGLVTVITDANADSILGNGEWFVELYAPWCKHCKSLEPIWNAYAKTLADRGSPIRLAKTDATLHTVTGDKLKAQGYPSLRYIKDGMFYEWRGPKRLPEHFDSYLESRFRQAPSHVSPYASTGNSASTVAAANNASPSRTTDRAPPARKSPLWDAEDAPGAKGRWDGSPTTSALVRDVTSNNWNERTAAATALLHLCSVGERQCVFYRPTLERVASTLLADGIDVIVIDCDVDAAICQQLGSVQPDVRMLKNGRLFKYHGARNHDSLVEFATGGYSSDTSLPCPSVTGGAPAAPPAPAERAAPAAAAAAPPAVALTGDVTQLTLTNFAATTKTGRWLIAFLRSDEASSEAFGALMTVLAAKQVISTASLATIDCRSEGVLCGAFGVTSTPGVAMLANNKYHTHRDAMTSAALSEFAEWRWSSMPGVTLGSQRNASDGEGFNAQFFFRFELWIAVAVSLFLGALLSNAMSTGGKKAKQH